METIGGLTKVGAGISMVAQLPSIFSDEDMTTGEKVLATITTIIPAFAGMASGMMDIAKSAPKMIASLAGMSGVNIATATTSEIAKGAVNGLKKAI
jgi:hypothetical protein